MRSEEQKDLDILYQAAGEKIGILLQTSDPVRAKARLYKARANACDPALADLSIRTSSIEGGNLIICHRRISVPLLPGPPTIPQLTPSEAAARAASDEL